MPIKVGFTINGTMHCYNPEDNTVSEFIEKKHRLHDCSESVLEKIAKGEKTVKIIMSGGKQ